MEKTNQWWAYEHVNGTLHVKRYLDSKDIEEAMKSDFVKYVLGKLDAPDRTTAEARFKELRDARARE